MQCTCRSWHNTLTHNEAVWIQFVQCHLRSRIISPEYTMASHLTIGYLKRVPVCRTQVGRSYVISPEQAKDVTSIYPFMKTYCTDEASRLPLTLFLWGYLRRAQNSVPKTIPDQVGSRIWPHRLSTAMVDWGTMKLQNVPTCRKFPPWPFYGEMGSFSAVDVSSICRLCRFVERKSFNSSSAEVRRSEVSKDTS